MNDLTESLESSIKHWRGLAMEHSTQADHWQRKCQALRDSLEAQQRNTAAFMNECNEARAEIERLQASLANVTDSQEAAKPVDDWHEDVGDAIWWTWRDGDWIGEPAYIGSPISTDWPGYHTHWTPHPKFPAAIRAAAQKEGG